MLLLGHEPMQLLHFKEKNQSALFLPGPISKKIVRVVWRLDKETAASSLTVTLFPPRYGVVCYKRLVFGSALENCCLKFSGHRPYIVEWFKFFKSVQYRVKQQTLPVRFFCDSYDMLQDIYLKFCIETLQTCITWLYDEHVSDSQF